MVRTLIKVDKFCLHYLINLQNVFYFAVHGTEVKIGIIDGPFQKEGKRRKPVLWRFLHSEKGFLNFKTWKNLRRETAVFEFQFYFDSVRQFISE